MQRRRLGHPFCRNPCGGWYKKLKEENAALKAELKKEKPAPKEKGKVTEKIVEVEKVVERVEYQVLSKSCACLEFYRQCNEECKFRKRPLYPSTVKHSKMDIVSSFGF